MMRKFILTNAQGAVVNLADENTFAYNIDNVGVSFANTYYQANSNFILSSTNINQGQFSVRVLFGSKDQQHYQRFSKFVSFLNYAPYTLTYQNDAGIYYRDCVLNNLTKSEINQWNTLDEEFILDFITPFYRYVTSDNFDGSNGLATGKIYSYKYPYEYDNATNQRAGYFPINNRSIYLGMDHGSPLEITIEGHCRHPSWELYKDTTIIQSDGYFLDVPTGYTLIVSSFPGNQYARLISASGVVNNVYQYQDLTRSNFITVPVGRYTLRLNTGTANVRWRLREEVLTV